MVEETKTEQMLELKKERRQLEEGLMREQHMSQNTKLGIKNQYRYIQSSQQVMEMERLCILLLNMNIS